MIKRARQLWQDRRGNVLALMGAGLPVLIGAAGLASDTIQWALWKRQLQRGADSAAFAGVYAKTTGATIDNCSNVSGATYSQPVAWDVKKNSIDGGVTHFGGLPLTCLAENSPSSGAYSTDPNAVRVILSVQKKLSFSSMFMSSVPTITAEATATVVPSGKYCVVSLESTATTGISVSGSPTVNLGCGMITNSTSMTAAVATGSSSVTASPIAAVGGIPASTNWGTGTVLQPFTLAQEDPFAEVYPPTTFPATCSDLVVDANQTSTVSPGCYKNITLKGNVTLSDGTYVLDGGSLVIESQARVTCNSCTFVLTNRSTASSPPIGTVNIAGGAHVDLTAPTAGTYQGILFYQDRRASTATNYIRGGSTSSFEGAFYFPKQITEITGGSGMDTDCVQLVALRVIFTGNTAISNTCPASSGASSFEGKKVRLVG